MQEKDQVVPFTPDKDNDQLVKKLIGQIYEASCNNDEWPIVLEGIAQLTRSKSAVLLYQDHEIQHASTFATYGLDPKWLSVYNKHYGDKDPSLAIISAVPTGQLTANHMVHNAESFYETETYLNFYRPQDIYHLAGTWLIKSPHRSALLGFQRAHSAPPYELEVLAQMEELVPHLQRALHIHKEYTAALVKNEAFASGIDAMQMGIIFLDHQLQISYCNQSAKAIINQHPALTISNDTIYATSDSDNRKLRKALAEASLASIHDGFDATVAMGLRHPSVFTPLPVMISPVHSSDLAIHLSKGAVAVVMVISDPDRMLLTSPELLATIYDLTPSEAEVAIDLANSISPKMIADRKGVRMSTVRTQIQSIYSKMGVSSQAQLIKILLNSPLASLR